MIGRTRGRVIPVGVVLLGVGCAADTPTTDSVTVDTVGSVIHVGNTGNGSWADGEGWSVAESGLEIGTVDGAPEFQFGLISAVSVGPGGGVHVADSQTSEIRVFDDSGAYLRTLGGEGEGPGEFRYLDGLRVSSDGTVTARDSQLMRVTRFSPDGEVIETFPIQRPFIQLSDRNYFWVGEDGRVWDWVATGSGMPNAAIVANVFSFDPSNRAIVDTAVVASWTPRNILITQDGRPRLGVAVPYDPSPSAAVTPDGRIVASLGERYDVVEFSPNGDTVRVVSRDLDPIPLPADMDATVDSLVRAAIDQAEGGEAEDYTLPSAQPYFTQLVVDDANNVWIGRIGRRNALPREYDIFDPDGRFLGTVAMPAIRVHEIGEDYVAGVRTDDLGISYAVVLPIVR